MLEPGLDWHPGGALPCSTEKSKAFYREEAQVPIGEVICLNLHNFSLTELLNDLVKERVENVSNEQKWLC